MELENFFIALPFLILFSICTVMVGIIVNQDGKDGNVLNDIIVRDLTGTDAVIYCIDNIDYNFRDSTKSTHCYRLLQVRNVK
jgi:hypothetical protein